MPQKVGGGGVTYALEASANEVDTHKEWKPEGNVIAQGEDGVPWELYENGYLLFKPEEGKDTLHHTSWYEQYGQQIKAIGFSDKVYAPESSFNLFSNMKSLIYFDYKNFDTSRVKTMANMFEYSDKISNLSEVVSNLRFDSATDISMMLRYTNLHYLDISKWNFNIQKIKSYYEPYESNKIIKLNLPTNFKNRAHKDFNFFDNSGPEGVKELNEMGYTDRWIREDGKFNAYTIYDLSENWTPEMAGVWIREPLSTKYTLNFDTSTLEQINPIEIEKDTQATFPTPTVDNPGYKFLGWSKTQDGEVITDTTNIANPSETITLYAKWEKVNNVTTQIVPIEMTTVYQGDNTSDKGQRTEEEGQVGEKEIVTTYKVTPITGELTEPTTIENIITLMKPKVVNLGTKPTEVEKQSELSITEKQTNTLVRGKERITQGRPRIEKEIIEYTVNETTGDITENKRIEVIDEGTPTVKEIGTREPNTIIRDVNGKDLTDDELPNYTNLEPNPTNTTDNGDLVYIVHKIITKYKGNDTLELNKQIVEKDGKTDGVKLIQVGTKPTIMTIERDNKQIKQTTTYIVNEDTGELTQNITEEIIGDVKPTTSNGTEAPLTFELPEYTKPISTNTPIDENGELVLPPTVDKLEYTGTLSTNTPVDKDDNLILPPIVEIPEYKDDIVNEPQKGTKEKLQPQTNNKQIPNEIYHQSDKKQDVVKDTDNTEVDNNKVVQKQALPKTNVFYSTPYVIGLLLSVIGLKQNKKD